MSRTRAHRPLNVRMVDKKDKDVHPVEHHHHAKGYCDLPPLDAKIIMSKGHLKAGDLQNKCYYQWEAPSVRVCHCSWCGDGITAKAENRKRRHTGKSNLRAMANEVNNAEDNSI